MVDSTKRMTSSRETRRLATDQARVGGILDERFELLELLGHGGMGAVYKARHLLMDKLVAVKMLLQDVADDPTVNDRFKREAKASGRVNHPNVVQLIDYGQGPEGAYIVVEYIDGIGLDGLLKREGALSAARAVHIFEQICEGVGKAHSKGIVHRDLKPSNVMITTEDGDPDFVKIVDFGLAKALDPGEESQKLTQSGDIFGSPVYMSPQQCLGHAADPRSDIYAMGVLMYETLTGKVPFLGANVGETIAKQLQEMPKPFAEMRPDLQIPKSLEKVVFKALEKDPENRQLSMAELKEEIIDAMLPKLQARKKTTILVKPAAAQPASAPGMSREGATDDLKTRVISSSDLDFNTRLQSAQSPNTSREAPPNTVKQPVVILLSALLIMLVACAGLLAANIFMRPPTCSLDNSHQADGVKPQANKLPMSDGRTRNTVIKLLPASSNLHSSTEDSHSLSVHTTRPLAKINEKYLQSEYRELRQHNTISTLKNKVKQYKKTIDESKVEHNSPVNTVSHSVARTEDSSTYIPHRKKHTASWDDFSYRYEKKGDLSTEWQPPVPGAK